MAEQERKTETIITDSGNVDLDYVVSGLVVDARFKKVSDGGPKNTATFELTELNHTFDYSGMTLGQLIELAMKQVRIDIASDWRKLSAASARATIPGGTTIVKNVVFQPRATGVVDPVKAVDKLSEAQANEAMAKLMEKFPMLAAQLKLNTSKRAK